MGKPERRSQGKNPSCARRGFFYLILLLGVYPPATRTLKRLAHFSLPVLVGAIAVGCFLTLAGACEMILIRAHQCIHNQFSHHVARDRFIAEFITVVTMYPDATAFRAEHLEGRHR